ncbi:MAG: pilus assembly protein [Actinobacteria bacterium]|nr:pilus assembly protein [Actinomycetota bacterium]
MHQDSEISEVQNQRRGRLMANVRAARSRLARERARGDSGGAVIELALLLPWLAVLVFGTIDLGRAWALKNRLTNMAREGASYAQFNSGRVNCSSGDDITKVAKAEDPAVTGPSVAVQWFNTSGVAVSTPTCASPATSGYIIRVKVTKTMTIITPLVSRITGNPVTVGGFEYVAAQGAT